MICSSTVPAVVLDTNVVLDWLVFGDPAVAPLAGAIEAGRLRWLGCATMQAELVHVLTHGNLAGREVRAGQVLSTVQRWQAEVELPDGLPLQRLRCRDTSDQVFLDLALHTGAAWLVSRDRALLTLARKAAREGLAIVSPRHWGLPAAA